MSTSREDMLRVLELLPVWQLRAPQAVIELAQAPVTELAPQPLIESAIAPAQAAPVVQAQTTYMLTTTAEKTCAFIWPASHDLSALQAELFNQILRAMQLQKPLKTTITNLENITARVLIAMGESAAQALLNTQQSLDQLRGKAHVLSNMPLIVTYHPNDCLQHLPNKAKTWDDLCLALSIIKA